MPGSRPYLQYTYYQLRALVESNRDDLDLLREVEHEFSFRNTDFAATLREALRDIIAASEKPASPFLFDLLGEEGLLSEDEVVEVFPFAAEGQLKGYLVGATGDQPTEEAIVRSIAFWNGAILGDPDVWADNQLIVVGRRGFDKGYLTQAIEHIVTKGIHIHFISQEVFLDFLQTGTLRSHYPGDPRIADHPGLVFLSSIGFKWPIVGSYRGTHKLENFEGEDHDLAIKYGYSVRAGVSVAARRKALDLGVSALGLQVVAYHIAGLIKRNSGNPIMKRAVPRWREDLEWLHQTRYLNSPPSFVWPSGL